MTFSIIKLASDFIQHIFLIVLCGLAFVEYFTARYNIYKKKDAIVAIKYVKAARNILIIVFMAAVWFIGEYFFDNLSLHYRLFFRWPLVFLILFAFIVFTKKNSAVIPYKIFISFIIALSLFIVLDIADYFMKLPVTATLLAFERIFAMNTFYFSFMGYFIKNRPKI